MTNWPTKEDMEKKARIRQLLSKLSFGTEPKPDPSIPGSELTPRDPNSIWSKVIDEIVDPNAPEYEEIETEPAEPKKIPSFNNAERLMDAE